MDIDIARVYPLRIGTKQAFCKKSKIYLDIVFRLWYYLRAETHKPHKISVYCLTETKQAKRNTHRKKGNKMKATNTTAQTQAQNQTFADLLREYETQAQNRTPQTETAYTKALQDLATATAYAVLKKCIETSQNPMLKQLKREIAQDTATLQNTARLHNESMQIVFDKDGNCKTTFIDSESKKACEKLCAVAMGEGLDLVGDAYISILSETQKAKERNNGILPQNFMETAYTTRRLKKKIYIKLEDSAKGWETVNTTPIQETYKAVRRTVQQSRAVQTAINGYTYLSDLAKDDESGAEETIFRRMPKYTDIGGYATDINGKIDYNSNYTANEQTAQDIDTLVANLNLTKRQAEILQLRLSGYGYKAIATYYGICNNAVVKTVKQIQAKATAQGLKPATK